MANSPKNLYFKPEDCVLASDFYSGLNVRLDNLIDTEVSRLRQELMWFKRTSSVMHIEPHSKPLKIGSSKSVLDVALSNRIDIGHTCGGMGSCTTCRVFVLKGEVSCRTSIERERATERGFQDNERLACQLKPASGLRVRLP